MEYRLLWLGAVFFAFSTSDASAYIDPGTGSVVTAAIIGFFAAAAYTVRKYFYKLTDLLRPRRTKDSGSKKSK